MGSRFLNITPPEAARDKSSAFGKIRGDILVYPKFPPNMVWKLVLSTNLTCGHVVLVHFLVQYLKKLAKPKVKKEIVDSKTKEIVKPKIAKPKEIAKPKIAKPKEIVKKAERTICVEGNIQVKLGTAPKIN